MNGIRRFVAMPHPQEFLGALHLIVALI